MAERLTSALPKRAAVGLVASLALAGCGNETEPQPENIRILDYVIDFSKNLGAVQAEMDYSAEVGGDVAATYLENYLENEAVPDLARNYPDTSMYVFEDAEYNCATNEVRGLTYALTCVIKLDGQA